MSFFPSGIVRNRWRPLTVDCRPHMELVMEANYVQVNNDQKRYFTANEEMVTILTNLVVNLHSTAFACNSPVQRIGVLQPAASTV